MIYHRPRVHTSKCSDSSTCSGESLQRLIVHVVQNFKTRAGIGDQRIVNPREIVVIPRILQHRSLDLEI